MNRLLLTIFILTSLLSCEPFELDRLEFVEVGAKVNSFGNTAAQVELNISGLKQSTVGRSGFVWSTTSNTPTLANNEGKKELGDKENGFFATEIIDLNSQTSYHIVGYVVFKGKEIYSDALTFTTGDINFSIGEIQYVRGRSMKVTGNLMGLDLRDPVSQYGHCWSKTNPEPNLREDPFSNLGRPNEDGIFTSTIEGLQRNETYHVRAYILSDFGTDTLYSEKTIIYQTDLVDVWHKIKDFPGKGRSAATSFSIGDTAYVGLHSRIDENKKDQQFYAYDHKTNQWTPSGEPYPHPDIGRVPFFVINDEVVYMGTLNNDDRVMFRFDPKHGVWTKAAPFWGPKRTEPTFFSINGKGYMGLGKGPRVAQNVPLADLTDFYEFDPEGDEGNGEWTEVTVGKFPDNLFTLGNRGRQEATIAIGGTVNKAYLVGVGNPGNNQVWEFTPGKGWDRKKDFPGGKTNTAVGFSIGDKGYIGTGTQDGLLYSGIFWEYDPKIDKWTRKEDFAGDYRRFATGFSLKGKGYIGTGDFGLDTKKDFWEYTPEKD